MASSLVAKASNPKKTTKSYSKPSPCLYSKTLKQTSQDGMLHHHPTLRMTGT